MLTQGKAENGISWRLDLHNTWHFSVENINIKSVALKKRNINCLLFALHFQWPFIHTDLQYIITTSLGKILEYHFAEKLINLR